MGQRPTNAAAGACWVLRKKGTIVCRTCSRGGFSQKGTNSKCPWLLPCEKLKAPFNETAGTVEFLNYRMATISEL